MIHPSANNETLMAIPKVKTPHKTIKMIESLSKLSFTKQTMNFGSFTGQHLGGNVDVSDTLNRFLQAYPRLRETAHYKKLSAFDAKTFPADITTLTNVAPVPNDTTVDNVKKMGSAPAVNTARVRDDRDIAFTDPHNVQIARKYVQLFESASKRNLEFNLSFADVDALISAERCFFTDEVMTSSGLSQRTVDRLDNKKGYITGNVVACTYRANQMKNYLFENTQSEIFTTPENLLKLLFKMKQI